MKKILLLLLSGIMYGGICRAQTGYTIYGKIRNLTVAKVYLVAADFGYPDTLASAPVENAGFVLTGKLPEGIRAVDLILAGTEDRLPMILENIDYQVYISANKAVIEGEGPAAKLRKKFEHIGLDYIAEQKRIEAEYKVLEKGTNDTEIRCLQARLDQAYKQSAGKIQELIKANADSYISAYVIALGMSVDDEAGLRTKYELLGPSARISVPGKAIAATLKRYEKSGIGEKAPEFRLTKPDGNSFALHSLPAKWKLLHFWASQNEASRKDNPELVKIYRQYHPQGLEIVSISLDDNPALWKQAVGTDAMIWTNGSDLKGRNSEITRLYPVNVLPTYILIDADNRIVFRSVRLSDIRIKIAEATKKKKKE